jgi:hypothetical protein
MDAEGRHRLAVLLQRHREFLLRQLSSGTPVSESLATRREFGTVCRPRATSRSTATHGRVRQALEKFDAALARLAGGSYGICTTCVREIALDRLNLVPATAYCLRCARHRPRKYSCSFWKGHRIAKSLSASRGAAVWTRVADLRQW